MNQVSTCSEHPRAEYVSPIVALMSVVRAKNCVDEIRDMAAPPSTDAVVDAEATAAALAPPTLDMAETTTELETADPIVTATMVVIAVFASI